VLQEPVRGPGRRGLRQLGERLRAAVAVAIGLRRGHGRLAEQVDGRGDPGPPEATQLAARRARGVAGDEAVGHVAHAGGHRGAERDPAGLRVGDLHRGVEGRRALRDLAHQAGEVAAEIVHVAARRRDVDEPEHRRAKLAVVRGDAQGAVVDRPHRAPQPGSQAGSQLAAHLEDLSLQPVEVQRG
jgi:hypothetical protein